MGRKLIHFEDCRIKINDIIYTDHISSHWDDIHILPAIPTNTSYLATIQDLKLQKLKSYHMDNKKAIELLEVKTEQRDQLSFGIFSFIGFIVLTISIYSFYRRRAKQVISPPIFFKQTTQHSIHTKDIPKPRFLWPSLHTKEGGVTETTAT